ncbi:A/G-specific adenine glycosylase [Maribellus maritimus]|uniref:A/G-specific adenine glycosylase n=1 Tax=Maribellus maritimus TaxID=2870838 RepID=UPI001EE9C875|nr:A/G-specific adenine glycosylase [Maribellus maritimus]MCG6190702.1 A/G-specific adenine glycosylase [Maribellus maritimus]
MEVFLDVIYKWFKRNRRELPWRQTTEPYYIWLSEIILQQTRVAQGTKYYLRFVERFPTVNDLAKATEDEVLKAWQGLGYYSRARNLHFTAKHIQSEFNGKFPSDYKGILKLKGVGPYTAAAIASIAFDLPYATVDGNIYRVLARYYGISTPVDSSKGRKEIETIAGELVPDRNAGFHNQALMEFGALQCIPQTPDCKNCVLLRTCFAAKNKQVQQLPVKTKKIKQQKRYFYYYFIENGEKVYIEKREGKDIWRNLYQFPLFETKEPLTEGEILNNTENVGFFKQCHFNIKRLSAEKKHILSHQVIFSRLVSVEISDSRCVDPKYIQVNKKDISKFAVPRLIEEFIKELNLNEKKD